jgi:formylglycine-generating enzyme required for sulfatase activity
VLAEVSSGAHEVRVSARSKKDYRQTVTVLAGQESRMEARLEDAGPAPGTVRENPKDGLKHVWIPPGTFQMGCSPGDSECGAEEKPSHQVRITKGFWIGQTEVTVEAFSRFTNQTGAKMPEPPKFNPGWSNRVMPIVNVSWDDAHTYCEWTKGRLPTEAEWEYAARGGSTQARYGVLDEVAWCSKNSGPQANAVAQKRANGFGFFDALGNVREWVNDWYGAEYYQNSPAPDSQGPAGGEGRVLRGGSWLDIPRVVRVSGRDRGLPEEKNVVSGLRCVWEMGSP